MAAQKVLKDVNMVRGTWWEWRSCCGWQPTLDMGCSDTWNPNLKKRGESPSERIQIPHK
jgi:hypothetical protein